MLVPAIAVLAIAVLFGLVLGGRYMIVDEPPKKLDWHGILHAISGIAGFALLVAALSHTAPSAHAVKMGVAGFGLFATSLIGLALVAGLYILSRHLRRRDISLGIVVTHSMLAIAGYTLLVTYLTMLH